VKILFFINGLTGGGKERQLIELMSGLISNSSIEFELIVMNKSIHYSLPDSVNVHYLIRKSNKDLSIFKSLISICSTYNPEIIHTWDTVTTFYSLPVCKIKGIKLINGSIRNAKPNKQLFGNALSKILFSLSNIVVANSKAGLSAYNIKPSKGFCIYNGFSQYRVENVEGRDKVRYSFGITNDYVVGMVGNFEVRKDFEAFIDVAIYMLNKRNDITFLTVGGGNELEKCKNMVPENLKKHILFVGEHKNVESIVNIFNIGVLLTNSQVHGEGISNSIMEYMALGKPVIATLNGGNSELITEKSNGYLIEDNNIKTIAEKIEYLIEKPDVAKQMGNVGIQTIKNDFSIYKMVTKYLSLYDYVLKEFTSQLVL
jgi:glycosyltransferase involved in cell wall biosynthesis